MEMRQSHDGLRELRVFEGIQERGDGMSILIRGMEMPKNCQECGLYIEGACYAKGYRDYRSIMDTSKPDDCPLIEIPAPHGRLILENGEEYEIDG